MAGVGVQHDTDGFATAWKHLGSCFPSHGKDPAAFPNALATMWFYITDGPAEAERVMRERIVPTIHRPEETLRERLPIGPAEPFAEKLTAFARAGVQRVFIWPVADETRQLELFWETVRPVSMRSAKASRSTSASVSGRNIDRRMNGPWTISSIVG